MTSKKNTQFLLGSVFDPSIGRYEAISFLKVINYTHKDIHIHGYIHLRTRYMDTDTHASTHAYIHIHASTHAYIHIHTHIHAYIHTRRYMHTLTHTHVHLVYQNRMHMLGLEK